LVHSVVHFGDEQHITSVNWAKAVAFARPCLLSGSC